MDLMSPQGRARMTIRELPTLTPQDVSSIEDNCPICLMSFASIFAEEVHSSSRNLGTEDECSGVTRLEGCGHVFCRKDLAEWINSLHGSCPTCRRVFLDIRPPSDSDDESSDGGEYIPEDEDEEEDPYFDTDGFSEDMEFDVEMDWDDGGVWQHVDSYDLDMGDWGLSDGDTLSEGDTSYNSEEGLMATEDPIAVAGDDEIIDENIIDPNESK